MSACKAPRPRLRNQPCIRYAPVSLARQLSFGVISLARAVGCVAVNRGWQTVRPDRRIESSGYSIANEGLEAVDIVRRCNEAVEDCKQRVLYLSENLAAIP